MTETYNKGDAVYWHPDSGPMLKADVLGTSLTGLRVKIRLCPGQMAYTYITYVKPSRLTHRTEIVAEQ